MYQISARAYLNRAINQFEKNTYDSLFYSAFELRCGIESRMQEYLNAQEHLSESQKNGWKIAILGKNIEKAFKLGDQIVSIQFLEEDKIIETLFYTPVRTVLRKNAQQLGNYLHAMQNVERDDSQWWVSFRDLLKKSIEELKFSTTGVLLGPPLKNETIGNGRLYIEIEEGVISSEIVEKLKLIGSKITMNVEYLDLLPNNVVANKSIKGTCLG